MASVTARLYNQLGERMRRYPLGYRLRGMWFARSFTSAGWLACSPGLPWPRVRNLGGKVEAGNCLFYSGVRLEVGRAPEGAERVAQLSTGGERRSQGRLAFRIKGL